ncbi:hypothetical protein F8388_012744 [Cannabis sativa]|uniref:Ubiquitin-like protease family profile domain-containing protein n=1 Tax=Cannabis sativa TaxID=3483 RepID=A0A7J6HCC7_CANSA|nr:hypothetical protein F8388_012744 [Cannabis sativa]
MFVRSSYMAGKRKRKGANEPVKKDVSFEPNDNAIAWRNFFNANYKALRAVEKGLTEKEITLTLNPVILPNCYSDSERRKSSVSGIDRELEEDAAGEVGKKAECSQAVEESPLKSPVRSKTNVVGQSEENVVESVTTPSLSATKSVEDEGYAHKTFQDDDFDIVEVASFWNKGKALVKSKKTQSEYVHLIEDDFNDKAYEQFIESGRTVVGPFKTKEAIPRNQYGFYKFVFSNTLDPGSLTMFVPVLTLEGAPHWFGAELNMKSKVVSFLESLHIAMDEKYRVDATKEMLSTLDLLFDENKSKNVPFVDFGIDSKDRGLPQQDNDRDCGVYVMKYMEVVANEEELVDQFHPIEARLEIAARFITDEQNQIRTKVVEDRKAAQGSSFASSSAPLRSLSKSPRDPRFSTAKSRHANMFPPSRASPRIRSSKAKISYGNVDKGFGWVD